jgi:hypothetical protein
MSNVSPVRALARRYAENLLERRAYVVERRQLIDAIVAGDTDLGEEIIDAPPEPAPVISTLSEFDATVELPKVTVGSTVTREASGRAWWLVLGLTMGLLGVASWLWRGLQ